ncbi:2',3'-cyclic-nucleotide 2'-phosphodiesterase / 3'-nucleotidase [Rhodovulum sp. ES.010]|uniref:bifunctional 2',3'-cyclic-nucleotide 2'-phosphodiesterase/3'-nucleotidase n=1 Tax=Rhodovulum sp. ES.010 TaxID=1882821 RepID=UPI00092594F2|nr:bifunctional 2',3'-cyclic-nucleotide 2'-phosphodiesterase/3'-nucleotidase [Rhodovulum sp. ES.010]SIO43449.1 2',3'-cyclic-nucleotide 2'-phosphodiesterase / 3'-nucleotidase [Rhodovulum sp. ES.010]
MTHHRHDGLNRRAFLAGSAAGASLIALHPFSARAGAGQVHLRLMETTDLHVHVYPYDYYSDRPVDTVGLARTAAHVAELRAEAANAMLVDNGDFLQGNPMGDFIAYERGVRAGEVHPIIRAMNAVGFDAATLGNHEFNYGLDFLMSSIAGAEFPVVSANIARELGVSPTADGTLLPPYVIVERALVDGAGVAHPIRVGFIGFVPPQIVTWDRKHLEGRVTTRDIVACARAWVPQMKEAGADLIVALNHSGIGEPGHVEGQENASVPLSELDGIDVIMTGHQHLAFPGRAFEGIPGVDTKRGTIRGKPAVMGGFWGSHLGVVDLMLGREAGEWRILAHQSALRPIARRNADRSVTPLVQSRRPVLDAVARDHADTLAYIRRAVGRTRAPLYSYFALVADDPSVQIVSNAQLWYVRELLKGTAHEGLPLLSAAAPFKAGGRSGPDYYTDVPAGDIAIKHVADLYLYPNTVRAVLVTGAQLRGWLERAAGMFNRITSGGRDQVLLNPDFPSYNFDVIDGVEYQIDLGQPARYGPRGRLVNPDAARIVDLTWAGRPVTDEMKFVVATNSYRAGGGGDFPGAMGDTIILEAPDTNRDVIVRYIAERGEIDPTADGNWRLAPMPGTTVLFDTGPKAVRYLDDMRALSIEPAGDGPDGFARFRIAL